MKPILVVLLFACYALGREANIEGKDNKVSIFWGPLIGYMAGDGYLPLRINYERYWKSNISFGGYLGTSILNDEDARTYEFEIGARKYFLGHFQRLSVGILPFAFIRDYAFGVKVIDSAVPVLVGYTWQWSRVFTGIEAGFGPGNSTSIKESQPNTSKYETIANGSLHIGSAF